MGQNYAKAYADTPSILGAFSVFQTGLVDRENKAKLNKIVEHIERLKGRTLELLIFRLFLLYI